MTRFRVHPRVSYSKTLSSHRSTRGGGRSSWPGPGGYCSLALLFRQGGGAASLKETRNSFQFSNCYDTLGMSRESSLSGGSKQPQSSPPHLAAAAGGGGKTERMEQSGQMVDCNYRDYSRYLERGGELIAHKKSTNNFPSKLHRMLSDEQHSDVISWMVSEPTVNRIHRTCTRSMLFIYPNSNPTHIRRASQPHGRAFKILNKERFMTEVIPAYLSCIKFESFTRQ